MTSTRRLSKLESSLPPRAAVFHWLDEAHSFPTASAYVAWLLTRPRDAYPLVGVPERVERATREAVRGRGGAEADRAVRDAISDAVFLIHLVLGGIVAAEEALRIEGLRSAALMWWMRALTCPGADAPRETIGWTAWLEVAHLHDAELRELDAAVASIGDRYLEGRDCLFPATRAELTELRGRAEALIDIGARMASSTGVPDPVSNIRVMTADDRTRTLVAQARAEAMGAVGRSEAAMAVVEQDLRARLGVV